MPTKWFNSCCACVNSLLLHEWCSLYKWTDSKYFKLMRKGMLTVGFFENFLLDLSSKYFFLLIYENLPQKIASSILMKCYQWGSCIPCKISTKEPMELAANSNFHFWNPLEDLNSRSKLNALNHSAKDPYNIIQTTSLCCIIIPFFNFTKRLYMNMAVNASSTPTLAKSWSKMGVLWAFVFVKHHQWKD